MPTKAYLMKHNNQTSGQSRHAIRQDVEPNVPNREMIRVVIIQTLLQMSGSRMQEHVHECPASLLHPIAHFVLGSAYVREYAKLSGICSA